MEVWKDGWVVDVEGWTEGTKAVKVVRGQAGDWDMEGWRVSWKAMERQSTTRGGVVPRMGPEGWTIGRAWKS